MARVTSETQPSVADKLSVQLVKALRELLLPLKRRVMNHDEHIKYLLAVVKAQANELEGLKEEISKLKQRVKWSEEA